MRIFSPISPGFSRQNRNRIRFHVWVSLACLILITLMVNYSATRIFSRLHIAKGSNPALSPLTTQILSMLDSPMDIVLYFNPDHGVFKPLEALVREFALISPFIRIRHIDYQSDPAESERVRREFSLAFSGERDVVLLRYKDHFRAILEADLSVLDISQLMEGTSNEIRRTAFKGEQTLTSAILSLSLSDEKSVVFIEGHSEADIQDTQSQSGYSRFVQSLSNNQCRISSLSLSGTNAIPASTSLVVIAQPRSPYSPEEIRKIHSYLESGGNVMACIGGMTQTGLEPLFANYGIGLADNVIIDLAHSPSGTPTDMTLTNFYAHPITRPFYNGQLYFFLPRSVHSLEKSIPKDKKLRIDEILYSSPTAQEVTSYNQNELNPSPKDRTGEFPLATIATRTIESPQGIQVSKLLVIGEALFLGNTGIQNFMNYEFGLHCANFLMERNLFIDRIPPKPIQEYKLNLTTRQRILARWVLLAIMPGLFISLGFSVHFLKSRGS